MITGRTGQWRIYWVPCKSVGDETRLRSPQKGRKKRKNEKKEAGTLGVGAGTETTKIERKENQNLIVYIATRNTGGSLVMLLEH